MLHTFSIGFTIGRIAIVKPTTIVRYHVSTQTTGVVAKHAFLAVFLETQIDNSLCIFILKTGQFSHITLLIYDLNLINHIGRDILGCGLHIIAKELLAVDTHGFNFLAIDGYVTLFIHLYTVHFLEQFLYGGGL